MGVLWGFLDQSLEDTALGEIIVNFPPMTYALLLFDGAVPLWLWRRGINNCGSCSPTCLRELLLELFVFCFFIFFLFKSFRTQIASLCIDCLLGVGWSSYPPGLYLQGGDG